MAEKEELDIIETFCPLLRRRRTKQMKPVYKFSPYKVVHVKPSGIRFPKPRSGHRIVADSGNVYCFGGYNPRSSDIPDNERGDFILMHSCLLFKELWKYNIASRKWSKMKATGQIPEELASHAAVLLGHNLIVFGGTGVPFGVSSSNSIHDCNLKTLVWTQMEAGGDPPPQQYGQAMAYHEGKLYVVGGTSGYEYSMNVHCLDLKSMEWSEAGVTTHPEPRYRHEIVIHDGKLFVFGGGTTSESFDLKDVPVFNLHSQLWEYVSTSDNHPDARLCHGCVKIGDEVFISGGHNIARIFPDIWSLNLKTLRWRKLPYDLIEPVYFHSAAASPEGEMFIFGGVTNAAENTRTNALYSMWLKIPSLAEMCWQAVLHYMPHISQFTRKELYTLGIPPRFLDRVDFDEDSQEVVSSVDDSPR